jgi:orotidine-5'-phosphate decarboxylase
MRQKIIIALDTAEAEEAKSLIDRLEDAAFFKIGLQSFLNFGEDLISYLHEKGKRLFLDLKFKDIPNTVHGAVTSALAFKPHFLTIHLSGGPEMVRQAVEAAKAAPELHLLGVTVLTSLSADDLNETGIPITPRELVIKLCHLGIENGIGAFVCSPEEIEPIRDIFGDSVTLVTPGIRPTWSAKGDQKRVFTPAMAIQAGSDYLVIGRPITKHPQPDQAFKLIIQEMSDAS